jgi:hypothetical protein
MQEILDIQRERENIIFEIDNLTLEYVYKKRALLRNIILLNRKIRNARAFYGARK